MNEDLEKQAFEIEQQKRKDDLLKIYAGDDRIISSHELRDEIKERPKSGFKLLTHLTALNDMFDGFREGNLVVVSGHSGDGKTMFCQNLTKNFALENIDTLWFTYEMTEDEFLERYGDSVPIFYLPREHRNSATWFRIKIREAVLKHPNTKVVFIDHLHFLIGMKDLTNNISNLSTYLGMLTQELKLIAIEYKIIFFLIVHPKKADNTQTLSLEDVGRDSSFIIQNADAVLTIWRERKRESRTGLVTESGTTFLSILKNRRKGKVGYIKLNFNEGRYVEL